MTGSVLVVGREGRVVAAVVQEIGRHGARGVGATTDDEALAALDAGDIRLLVIGGGIGHPARDTLSRRARARGVDVVGTPLRDLDIDVYVGREIVPRLREGSEVRASDDPSDDSPDSN
ncbi:hypothetical protein ACFUN8_13235 [Streptomyces sp. NPDC057307]|uniref:hypothetical protein n=1 Tax=Streptomyces sp. NPDC057307 TaxID=3346096 RepID=UPI0036294771